MELAPVLMWALPWLSLPALGRRRPALAEPAGPDGRLVSVIVPARNESRNIEGVLHSLRATTWRNVEFIVVDDRSSDDTATLAEAVALDDSRVRVVRGAELPEGWFGKSWACVQGFLAARGELLLFTDADTRHSPDALARAVASLDREQAGMLTVITQLVCIGFWERVVMPQVWVPLGLRFSAERVNRQRTPRDVIANGQFVLIRREVYERIGTHEVVRGEVAEDLALAQAVVRSGARMHMAFALEQVSTRMYTSLGELIEGWSKNVYLGGRASFPEQPVLRALVPLLLAVMPLFWLAPTVWLAAGGGAVAGAAWLVAAGFWVTICAGMGVPARFGLLYPLGAAVLLFIVVRSVVRGGRLVEWRGRTYAPGA